MNVLPFIKTPFLLALVMSAPAMLALLAGTTSEWPAVLIFAALILTVLGVMLFSTGALFNYIVSLFHHRYIRQGLFGQPIFRTPLEHYFGRIGFGVVGVGVMLYVVTRLAGLAPTPWFYPVVSAMLVLIGVQLLTSGVLVQVLSTLSERETQKLQDLNGSTVPAAKPPEVPVTVPSVGVTH